MIVTPPAALKINTIADRGDAANERVHLEVIRDCDLGSYIVMATVEVSPGRVYAGFRPAYWFTAKPVKTGDHIIVYTKAGKDSTEPRPDGHLNHFYYWGVVTPMFAGLGRVVLGELNAWQTGG